MKPVFYFKFYEWKILTRKEKIKKKNLLEF